MITKPNHQIAAASPAADSDDGRSADSAWLALGRGMRRYIIMQHGRIDGAGARDACDLPWTAVRNAIEDANDEFDGDAAEEAVMAAAAAAGTGTASGGGSF